MSASARPLYAAGFYPDQPASCIAALDRLVAAVRLPPDLPSRIVGALVPHAGWVYSGRTAAYAWLALTRARPDVIVLLGAVHRPGVHRATVWSGGPWGTPLGDIPIDSALRAGILEEGAGAIEQGEQQHVGEHSLEVQAPFIKRLMPNTSIVPIQVPADARAPAVGKRIAAAIQADARSVVVVASSDLTHYGRQYGFAPAGVGPAGLAWGRANDARLIARALDLDSVGVLEEAAANHNACGSGALAAATSACRALGGTSATLLHQTTSHDERPGDGSMFVGYASILYGT